MRQAEGLQLLFLVLLALILLFPGLDSAELIDWDENIYAEASRQMVLRGDYLNITINNHPFAEKPPLFFWLQSAAYHLFGISEFAARFPSAVSGLLLTIVCYTAGRLAFSHRLGMLWGLIFLTSLLPGVFARSAVIDHTFNLFIALSACLLLAYDSIFQRQKVSTPYKDKFGTGNDNFHSTLTPVFTSHWFMLTAASIFMGLAVLTKGPLGGVIPLVAFAGYKILSPQPKVPITHFIFCGVLSLSVACSWYAANWVVHGSEFIKGFVRFQLMLFNRPLEGHTGPFYYHWLTALFGMLPWTAVLLLGPFKPGSFDSTISPLLRLSASWVLFVLALFSLVSTKLPHYSASVYIPLSLWAASMLESRMRTGAVFPPWFWILLPLTGVLLAVGFMVFPHLAQNEIEKVTPGFNWAIPAAIYWCGIMMLLLFVLGSAACALKWMKSGIALMAVGMLFWTQGLWRYQVPLGLSYLQDPMLSLVEEVHREKQHLVFYRYVSFAALFYGRRPITMLHTYKFPGDPTILDTKGNRTISVITKKKHEQSLIREHPLLKRDRDAGEFVLYRLPAKTGQ